MIASAGRVQAAVIGLGSLLVFVLVLALTERATADTALPEVHSDEWLSIRAGIDTGPDGPIELGEVLSLRIVVNYDAARVAPLDIDETFFTTAWPTGQGPSLRRWRGWKERHPGKRSDQLLARFDFQLLSCPERQLACFGARRYRVPEFTLRYTVTTHDDEVHVARFRPIPTELVLDSLLRPDTDSELLSFDNYFPEGAYPDPLVSDSALAEALVTTALVLSLLSGGIFMRLFGRRGRGDTATQGEVRWQWVLQQLGSQPEQQEARLYDKLRRAIVWFCVDELKTDPYGWLSASPPDSESQETKDIKTLRQLFIELLQNPPGQGPELQARFEAFVADSTNKS